MLHSISLSCPLYFVQNHEGKSGWPDQVTFSCDTLSHLTRRDLSYERESKRANNSDKKNIDGSFKIFQKTNIFNAFWGTFFPKINPNTNNL